MSMSAAFLLVEPLENVLQLMNVELSTCYSMKSRGLWTWLERRGRYLVVDLLAAADFFDASLRPHVAERLRERAELRLDAELKQRVLADSLRDRLREAVGQ